MEDDVQYQQQQQQQQQQEQEQGGKTMVSLRRFPCHPLLSCHPRFPLPPLQHFGTCESIMANFTRYC
ncbi:hypothetical protein SOVF_054940 [Spinacia oleracea]|nr:hypothetical protein SOVF_054940 [Spinacia oleracea]